MAKGTTTRAWALSLASCLAAGACAATNGGRAASTASAAGPGGGSGAGGEVASGGAAPEGGADDALTIDASGYCGDQFHEVVSDPPNLYFVLDASSSMAQMAGGGFTKYQLVEHSAVSMIETLGPLINVGAAVFPHLASASDPCHVGAEVFPVSPGDPIGPMTGPTTEGFITATSLTPSGGTPTAATLAALAPKLGAIPGRTVVILATDGAPNCDTAIACGADQCIPNLEGQCTPASSNCCAAGGQAGPAGCVDHDAAVAAVAALAKEHVRVVVIGVPGSDLYASVLSDMAMAGGAPQPGPPYYYAVDDLNTLTGLFQTLAASYVSCDVTLQDPPADMDHTNVYFDGTVVLQDPSNGWVWGGGATITLVGAACQELKAGKVKQIQVVSGCPTMKAP